MLNSQGEESYRFQAGEEFTFAILIHNKSGEDILWYDWCDMYNDQLYTFYKMNSSDKLLPYSVPINCEDIGLNIRTGEAFYFTQRMSDLPTGNYIVRFNYTLTIDSYQSAEYVIKQFTVE